jgi:hypothetical protein
VTDGSATLGGAPQMLTASTTAVEPFEPATGEAFRTTGGS